MIDIVLPAIRRKVSLSNVRCVIGIVNEYVIPGLILRWSRRRHLLIPSFRAGEDFVDVKDQSPITESVMNDLLPNRKLNHDEILS